MEMIQILPRFPHRLSTWGVLASVVLCAAAFMITMLLRMPFRETFPVLLREEKSQYEGLLDPGRSRKDVGTTISSQRLDMLAEVPPEYGAAVVSGKTIRLRVVGWQRARDLDLEGRVIKVVPPVTNHGAWNVTIALQPSGDLAEILRKSNSGLIAGDMSIFTGRQGLFRTM